MSQSYALEKGAIRCYQAVGTTDISTTSTSYVDMADMSITFTLKQKKDVMVFFQAPIQKRNGQFEVKLVVDGSDRNVTVLYHHDGASGNEYTRVPTSLNWKENLAAGQHTVKMQWKIAGGNAAYSGTGTASPNAGGARVLQVLELGAEQENPIVVSGGGDLLHVRDEKPTNTDADASVGSAWTTRTLNTVKTNEISGASVVANQITLPAGTYRISAKMSQYGGGYGHARLRNITTGTTVLVGTNIAPRHPGEDTLTVLESNIDGQFTIVSTSVFEIQHYVRTSYYFGYKVNDGTEVEVYGDVQIYKIF